MKLIKKNMMILKKKNKLIKYKMKNFNLKIFINTIQFQNKKLKKS